MANSPASKPFDLPAYSIFPDWSKIISGGVTHNSNGYKPYNSDAVKMGRWGEMNKQGYTKFDTSPPTSVNPTTAASMQNTTQPPVISTVPSPETYDIPTVDLTAPTNYSDGIFNRDAYMTQMEGGIGGLDKINSDLALNTGSDWLGGFGDKIKGLDATDWGNIGKGALDVGKLYLGWQAGKQAKEALDMQKDQLAFNRKAATAAMTENQTRSLAQREMNAGKSSSDAYAAAEPAAKAKLKQYGLS